MRKILQLILDVLAKLYLWRYRPIIVAITGNMGKTSTKEAIAAVLRIKKRIRVSGGNLNNELGVPATILGDWSKEYYSQGPSINFWFRVIFKGFFGLMFSDRYPQVLILEYGADRPGDIKKLAQKFRPHIGVVTGVGDIPVHVEFFASPKELANEKSELVKAVKGPGCVVLNYDDLTVLEMRDKTKARAITFGFGDGAMVKVSNIDISFDDSSCPSGMSFKLHHDGSFVPVKIKGALGKSQGLIAAAAAAVGIIFNMNLVQISEALGHYNSPPGRLRILKGIKNTILLDDTYNASPAAMHMALETLAALPDRRRVAILGDMLELGKYSIEAHQTVGDMAGRIATLLVCVGQHARFIADSAANEMLKGNIHWFENSEEARSKIQDLIEEGDVILIKGSQSMRMEKITEELLADPENQKSLLVRQSKTWLR